MLTACSRDYPDLPGTSRDSHRWERGRHPVQPAVLAVASTARNGAQMTHNPAAPWAKNQGHQGRQQAWNRCSQSDWSGRWGQRASAAVSRSWGWWDRLVRSARSAWRRSGRLARWPASRWLRSARRMIAHARVVGLRAWLSLYNSTTTLAPRVAYCSSRRTHSYSSAGDRSRAGRAPGVEGRKHRVQAWGGRLAAALAGGGDGPLADGFGVGGACPARGG
jgi:hypothetical protein